MEQFMDFLRNRMFRQTLLCHKNIQIQRHLKADHLKDKYIAANLEPVREPIDVASNSMEHFRAANGVTVATSDPIMKTALSHLADLWPQAVKFEKLLATARRCLSSGPVHDAARLAEDAQTFGTNLLKCFAASTADLRLRPGWTACEPGGWMTTRTARYQAERGIFVTNTTHSIVQLNDLDRHVVRHLDGECDEGQLLVVLMQLVADRILVVDTGGVPQKEDSQLRGTLATALAESLARVRRQALLANHCR
jgi:methyltransferase-like protein